MNKLIFKMKNQTGDNFTFSDVDKFSWSKKASDVIDEIKDTNFFNNFKHTELKANLDLENEGSSKKIIDDLINKKIMPKASNEQLILNINQVYNYISATSPIINKNNIMIIYNMLITNINTFEPTKNALEDPFDWRKGAGMGFIGKFKTPSVEVMRSGMEDLISFINSDLLDNKPLEKACLIQTVFIYYHPFYDYNGKTGRILSTWYLKSKGLHHLSELLTFAISQERTKYIRIWNIFRKYDDKFLDFWIGWLSTNVLKSIYKASVIYKRIKKEGKVLNKNQVSIIFIMLDNQEWISVDEILKKTQIGISRTAIDKSLLDLVKQDIFEEKVIKHKRILRIKWKLTRSGEPGKRLSFLNKNGSFAIFPSNDELEEK